MTTDNKIFTREDYLNKRCTHRQYYSQFVTDSIKQTVLRAFSIDKLVSSYKEDDHLNSIPLQSWDMIAYKPLLKIPMKSCGDYLTKAGAVCIFKEAAYQIIEEHDNR